MRSIRSGRKFQPDMGFGNEPKPTHAKKDALGEILGHGWPILEFGRAASPRVIAGCGLTRSWTDRKRKWPKEVPLGEHTSLGPKSYCPDYRNLPVT